MKAIAEFATITLFFAVCVYGLPVGEMVVEAMR